MRTYMVKIRLKGSVSWVEVQARDAGQAKALVRAQYGDSIDILEAKPAEIWESKYPVCHIKCYGKLVLDNRIFHCSRFVRHHGCKRIENHSWQRCNPNRRH